MNDGSPNGQGSAPPAPRPSPQPAADFACPSLLADTRIGGTQPNIYVEPSKDDRRAARSAMAALVSGDAGAADLAKLGLETVPIPEWPDAVLVREKDTRVGRGAYVVRASPSHLVVQAPHTFFDEGTFPLACELFHRGQARAFFFNTVHRYKGAPAGSDGKHASDVAHSPLSLFQAMTEGLLDAIPRADVLQVHGFQNREATARAVVSVGEKRPGSPLVARAARLLETAVGPRVLRYPEDTNELGATTNVQGVAVRHRGGRFVHVEMDEGLRRELLGDAALRGKAFDALVAIFEGP
jgi:hypothetical protein